MCGRYANRSSGKELQSFFDTMQTVGDELPPPSYNVAPTQPVRVILERTPTRGTRRRAPPAPAQDGQMGLAPCLVKRPEDGVQADQRPQ